MSLSIRSRIPAPEIDRSRLRRLARRLLRAEHRLESTEISLLLCGDEVMRGLNREFRGKDEPTDVLSFAQEEGPSMPLGWAEIDAPPMLGDVALSIETAREGALERGWSVQEEVEALFVHGILHLLGYDHEKERDRAEMQEKENELLGKRSIWAFLTQDDSGVEAST